jgi:DNA-binding PadR family transcriptional regulator
MGAISEKETAVLGIIAEAPSCGYELEKIISDRHMRRWTDMGFSSIYFILKSLEKKGLICKKAASTRREKNIYSISAKGKKALKSSLFNMISSLDLSTPPYTLALVNISLLTKAEKISAFSKRLEKIESTIAFLGSVMEPYKKRTEAGPLVLYDWFTYMANAEIAWVSRFIEKTKECDYR